MNKKILIVSYNWKNIGGVQKRAELLKEKFSNNYNIDHIFINYYLKSNIFKLDNLMINIRNFLNYRNKLKEYKIVIAFSNLPSLLSIFSKCKLITVITGSTFHYKESSFISKLYWALFLEPLIYLFSKRIIPAAPHLVPFYIKKTALHNKVKYINGFIDLNKLKSNEITDNELLCKFSNVNLKNCICLSSTLIGHKGIIEFLEIYLEYKNKLKIDYLSLIIIGNGPILKDCFDFCNDRGLTYEFNSKLFNIKRDIYFTGHIENPLSIIQKCRFFVMPSFHEGLSNQLLEAVYAGIPIIATNCHGNKFIYKEIAKENREYINSHFLKLLPIIKNSRIKSIWAKELIYYSENIKGNKYKNSNKLIENFSSDNNFIKWESTVRNILNKKEIR